MPRGSGGSPSRTCAGRSLRSPLAIIYSFNAGSTVTHWEGASLRWWVGDPAAQESIVYDPALRAALLHSLVLASWTMVIAVPAARPSRWVVEAGGRASRASASG